MSAEVRKLPKVYRVAQRWEATCEQHTGLMSNVKPRDATASPHLRLPLWRGGQRRSQTSAMYDARSHNREHHKS